LLIAFEQLVPRDAAAGSDAYGTPDLGSSQEVHDLGPAAKRKFDDAVDDGHAAAEPDGPGKYNLQSEEETVYDQQH
jgi:hypothetical protein